MNAETVRRYQVLLLGIAAGVAVVLWTLRYVWAVLIVGFIIAAALLPVIDWLNRFMPRVVAILVTYLGIIGALSAALVPGVIPLITQAGQLSGQLSRTFANVFGPGSPLGSLGISMQSLFSYIKQDAVTITTSALSVAAAALAVLVISIYFLYDWHERQHAMQSSANQYWRAFGNTLADASRSLGAWVRGEIVLSAIVGGLVLAALLAIGIPFAPVLAVFAGMCEFIPYAGPFLAATPSVLLGASQSLSTALTVALAYLIIQQLEAHLFVPLVMKNILLLHPVTVIIAILLGFELMGIIGALLAVPVTVLGQITLRHVAGLARTS